MYPEAFLRTATDSPEALLFPISRAATRHLHRAAIHRHPVLLPAIMHLQGAAPQNQNGYARGGQGRTNVPQGNVPQNGYRQPQNGYAPNPGSAPNYAQGNPNQQPFGGYAPGNGAAREHRAAIREMDLPRLQNSRQRHFPLSLDADAQKFHKERSM